MLCAFSRGGASEGSVPVIHAEFFLDLFALVIAADGVSHDEHEDYQRDAVGVHEGVEREPENCHKSHLDILFLFIPVYPEWVKTDIKLTQYAAFVNSHFVHWGEPKGLTPSCGALRKHVPARAAGPTNAGKMPLLRQWARLPWGSSKTGMNFWLKLMNKPELPYPRKPV